MTTDNSGKTYYFNCDRCRVEWINKENNSECLCCKEHGRNVSKNKKKKRFDDIACLECEISWKGVDPCPKCNQNGLKILIFRCTNKDCPLKCWDDTKEESNCPNCKQNGTMFQSKMLRLKCQQCSIEWSDKMESNCPSCDGKSGQVSKKNHFKRFSKYACVSCRIEWDENHNECPKCKKQGVKICLFKCSKCNVKCWDDLKENSACPACSSDGIALKPKNRENAISEEDNKNEPSNVDEKTKEKHQFACSSCENIWWTNDLVSECNKCNKLFKALSKDNEFGTCIFKCECGNSFIGRGAMKIKSKCYKCNEMILPSKVLLNKRRNLRKRKPVNKDNEQKHSCEKCEGKEECSIYSKILFNSEPA